MHLLPIVFIVFVVIQSVYITLFLIAFSRLRLSFSEDPVPVSIIVCAHNEEKNLRELIPLLLRQEYPEFEIIIVEDRGNDDSFDFLYEATKHHNKLRVVQVKNKPEHINGKKYALTLGLKAAKHEWVLLTDADCRPGSKQWIKEMSNHFSKDTAIVIGFSPYQKAKGLLNSFIRYEGLLTAIQYLGMAIMGKPYMGVGRNLAYRKNLFLENKGFKSHLSITGGDDDLFVNQLGNKKNTAVAIGVSTLVYSKPKTTWEQFYFQKLRHLSVGKQYKAIDKLNLGLFNLSLIGTWLLIIPAVMYSPLFYIPLGVFLLRICLLTLLAHKASRKLGESFGAWKVFFLDFIFVIYYLVIGLQALHSNKVRWKKT